MHSYVINLDRSPDRLEHMSRRLNELGIAWSRVSGVDGRTFTDAQLNDFRAQRKTSALGHAWSAGQIGCFLSHMACLREIAAGPDDWAVVFEDDVHISPELPRFLMSDAWIPHGADIIRLETTYQGMRLGPAVDTGFREFKLLPVKRHSWGAAAYAIQRDVARWLVDAPARFHAPADWYLFHRPTTVAACLAIYQIKPALCVQDQYRSRLTLTQGFPSNIDVSVESNNSLAFPHKIFKSLGRIIVGKQVVRYREDE